MKILLLRVLVPVLLLFAWAQCANVQSPTGGPKDKRPPKLVSSIPKANATNFKGTTILLTFDEAVKLNSPREEIIISPSPGKDVDFVVKGNRVFITPKIPLKDSTTYSFLFREGIQDITENNPPVNLRLSFSTGPYTDSLLLAGEVHDVLLGTPKEKMTVAIYSSDTFNIFNHTPNYFTQSDKKGNFKLENLRPGRYRIYAFDDDNKNLKVESRSEMFGFLANEIILARNIDTLSIGLVQLDSRPLRISSIRNLGKMTRVKFSKSVIDYELTASKEITHCFGDNLTEINVWNPPGPDSLKVTLSARDSLNSKKDTVFYVKVTDARPVKEKFTWLMGKPEINPENPKLITTLTFNKPIRNFNFDSLYIQIDTTQRIPITKENITYVPQRRELKVIKDLPKKLFGADQNPLISLYAKRTFAISIEDDTAKVQSAPALIYWPEENGILTLQANTKVKNYILQLVEKGSGKPIQQVVNTPRLVAKNIPPGNYYIRAVIDTNQNGSWDPGNFSEKVEPEKIIYYNGADGSRTIPVRANWEIGPLQFSF